MRSVIPVRDRRDGNPVQVGRGCAGSAIAGDLGTTVSGVETAITLFTLTMAALMIPGSKLTDIWGRRRCFVLGLAVYAVGGCWRRG